MRDRQIAIVGYSETKIELRSGRHVFDLAGEAMARVIEQTGFVWKLVLHGIILPFRPRRKGRDYAKIWNNDNNESPLKTITRSQAEKLTRLLSLLGKHVTIDWAMRYGQPSIASRLAELAGAGCERILLVPLYPQYAAATTATVCDAAFRALIHMRRQPSLRVAPPYFDDPVYIDAVASSIRQGLAKLPFVPDVADNIKFGDSFISHDLQLSYVLKLKERVKLEATAQLFNAFNVSNLVGSAGLPSSPFNGTLMTLPALPTGFSVNSAGALVDATGGRVIAGVSRLPSGALITSGFGSASAVRPSIPTGTGLPRAAQFGVRLSF